MDSVGIELQFSHAKVTPETQTKPAPGSIYRGDGLRFLLQVTRWLVLHSLAFFGLA